jgi:hypothetical protein
MTDLIDRLRWAWTHLAWFVAAIIVMIDPNKIFEWAHKHEVWGGLIAAAFTALLAWAAKQRGQGATPTHAPPTNRNPGRSSI